MRVFENKVWPLKCLEYKVANHTTLRPLMIHISVANKMLQIRCVCNKVYRVYSLPEAVIERNVLDWFMFLPESLHIASKFIYIYISYIYLYVSFKILHFLFHMSLIIKESLGIKFVFNSIF